MFTLLGTLPDKSGLVNFFYKGTEICILGSVGHKVSVTTGHLCHCSANAAMDNTSTNRHGCVQLKLYLWTLNFEFQILFICH